MYHLLMTMLTTTTSLEVLARFGHALSDSTRLKILVTLSEGPSYPADMADNLQITRQSISNHLLCLRGCGLVTTESVGRRSRYQLANEHIKHALGDLQEVILKIDPIACDMTSKKEQG